MDLNDHTNEEIDSTVPHTPWILFIRRGLSRSSPKKVSQCLSS